MADRWVLVATVESPDSGDAERSRRWSTTAKYFRTTSDAASDATWLSEGGVGMELAAAVVEGELGVGLPLAEGSLPSPEHPARVSRSAAVATAVAPGTCTMSDFTFL
jgi:hypothetical protein